MSDASEPSTPTQDTPTQGHSTKPVDEKKAAELMAIRKFRDDKELPFSNEDLFKYVGVSRTVGYRIFKGKHRRFQTNPDFEETRGRPRALTDDQVNHLVTFLQTEGWEGRSMPWSRLCEAARLEFPKRGKAPASRTIKNFLNQRGWKKCVKCSNFWIDHHKSSRLHCLDCFYEASTKAKAGTSNTTSKTTSKPPAKTTAQATSQATSKQPSRVQVDNRGAWPTTSPGDALQQAACPTTQAYLVPTSLPSEPRNAMHF